MTDLNMLRAIQQSQAIIQEDLGNPRAPHQHASEVIGTTPKRLSIATTRDGKIKPQQTPRVQTQH